jgi:hypothetical protein
MYEKLARFLEALRDLDSISHRDWDAKYGDEFGTAFNQTSFDAEFITLTHLLADADPVLDMLRAFDEG